MPSLFSVHCDIIKPVLPESLTCFVLDSFTWLTRSYLDLSLMTCTSLPPASHSAPCVSQQVLGFLFLWYRLRPHIRKQSLVPSITSDKLKIMHLLFIHMCIVTSQSVAITFYFPSTKGQDHKSMSYKNFACLVCGNKLLDNGQHVWVDISGGSAGSGCF